MNSPNVTNEPLTNHVLLLWLPVQPLSMSLGAAFTDKSRELLAPWWHPCVACREEGMCHRASRHTWEAKNFHKSRGGSPGQRGKPAKDSKRYRLLRAFGGRSPKTGACKPAQGPRSCRRGSSRPVGAAASCGSSLGCGSFISAKLGFSSGDAYPPPPTPTHTTGCGKVLGISQLFMATLLAFFGWLLFVGRSSAPTHKAPVDHLGHPWEWSLSFGHGFPPH